MMRGAALSPQPALQNTALRLMMTEKEPAAQLSRLAPGADLTALLALAARARDALIAAGAVGLRDPIHVVSKARPASELALRQPFCGMSCGLRGHSRQIINRLSVHSGGSQCSALLLCPRFRQEHFLSAAPSSDLSCAIAMCQVNLRPGEWLLAGPAGVRLLENQDFVLTIVSLVM